MFIRGIEFYVPTITQNVTICIVAEIYKQEPTSCEFLNTQLKNIILKYVLPVTFSCGIQFIFTNNHLQLLSSPY